MAIGDGSISGDDVCFRDTVDTPFDADAAISVRADAGIGITQFIQPGTCLFGRVLIIDTIERNLAKFGKLDEQRMFRATWHAPGCKHIHQ